MAKKAAPRSTAPKTAPAPAATAAPKTADASAASRPRAATKAEFHTALAEKTGLAKHQVAGFFSALNDRIGKELGKKGPGQFVLSGLLKLKVVRKPATKARPGKNPFTGAAITIQARPASNVVRAIPMKALKDLV